MTAFNLRAYADPRGDTCSREVSLTTRLRDALGDGLGMIALAVLMGAALLAPDRPAETAAARMVWEGRP